MKNPFDQFRQEVEDFWRGKKYPEPLAKPLYVDPKKWGPEPDGGKVHRLLTKAQRQYRQEIENEFLFRWKLLFVLYGIEDTLAGRSELIERLVARHVPGFQTTVAPPKPKKRRGRRPERGPLWFIDMVLELDEARALRQNA